QRAELQRGRMVPPETARNLVTQVATGLSYSHAMGIHHLSLDPYDILVSLDGRVWVTGFERSIIYEYYRACKVGMLGTLVYASPELLHGGTLDAATDVFHIGIILFELLTGSPPFVGLQDFTRLGPSTNDLQAKLHKCSDPKLGSISLKCLQFRKED